MANAFAEETAGVAEVERVIVTGSNIPTAEEIGPNPVDTYRTEDIEKLGVHNTTDLLTKLPQEMGSTINQNMRPDAGMAASYQTYVVCCPKKLWFWWMENARHSWGWPNCNRRNRRAGVDINLIPFPMIDHIDILKDGASAIYGSDAVAGVINIFLKHKFRGLEIGGSIGNTNIGASNDAREPEAWMIAGTGDDKTDILVIADFYDRAAIYSRDRNLTSTQTEFAGVDLIFAAQIFPGAISEPIRVDIRACFLATNSPPPHSAPNAAHLHTISVSPRSIGRLLNGPVLGWRLFRIQFRGSDASDSGGGSSKLLWLVHPRYLRQVSDGVCRL